MEQPQLTLHSEAGEGSAQQERMPRVWIGNNAVPKATSLPQCCAYSSDTAAFPVDALGHERGGSFGGCRSQRSRTGICTVPLHMFISGP